MSELTEHGRKALERCIREHQKFIELADDYDLDEMSVQALQTGIESMQMRLDASKPVGAEAVVEPAFWMVPGLASMCNALGDAAIVHNVHLATKPHNGFTAPLYTRPQPVTPAGGEVDSFEPWRAEVVALLVSKYGFSSEAATVFASSEVSEYIDGDCDCAEMLPVDLTDILMDVASDAVETWKRESVGRPFGYKSPAGGEVGPFGWWMECNGTDDDFGQFVRDPEFLENMRSHGVVTAATALYTNPPVADAALDSKRLDWLEATTETAYVSMCFELDGGVHLTIEAPDAEMVAYREKDSIRAAIDAALNQRGGA